MRPKLNTVKWKVTHISITIYELLQTDLASSTKSSMSRDQFFSAVVDYLDESGYVPRMPIANMKQLFKSPYSNSEYYTFLKVEGNQYIKVVLDIRLTDHYHEDWGNYTERERHLYYMRTKVLPDLQQERGLDTSSADTEFIDVSKHDSTIFELIDVDGSLFNSYEDALVEVKQKIDALP